MTNRSNESYGLQRKEFGEKVGLTDRQVLYFCELNVFNPVRPDDAPNNRRYFTESDFKAAELIQMLIKLGHSPVEIGRIFEKKNHDLDLILDSAIKLLKKRIIHDRNLVMAAEYAQSVGTSLFTFSDMSDSDIDKFANAVRKSESYKKSMRSIRKLSSDELEALGVDLKSTIIGFSELVPLLDDDTQFSENFLKIENLVDNYISNFSTLLDVDPHFIMLFLGAVYFFGNGDMSSNADDIGGANTAKFMGFCFLMTWIKRMSRLVFPLVLLLNDSKCMTTQTDNILKELLNLFDVGPVVVPKLCDSHEGDNALEVSISLIEILFDFVKEFSSNQDFMQTLYINEESLPSEQQFDNTLTLLNKYANQSFERKEV